MRKTYRGTIYFGVMSNSSPTKESTQAVVMESILLWTPSQVNSGSVVNTDNVEQTRGQRHTGRNDLPGRVRGLLSGW